MISRAAIGTNRPWPPVSGSAAAVAPLLSEAGAVPAAEAEAVALAVPAAEAEAVALAVPAAEAAV